MRVLFRQADSDAQLLWRLNLTEWMNSRVSLLFFCAGPLHGHKLSGLYSEFEVLAPARAFCFCQCNRIIDNVMFKTVKSLGTVSGAEFLLPNLGSFIMGLAWEATKSTGIGDLAVLIVLSFAIINLSYAIGA